MGSQPVKQRCDAADYLIAIIACEGIYNDGEEMFLACKKEVERLLQDQRAMFVYWDGILWIGGVPHQLTYENLTQDSTSYLEQVQKDIVRNIHENFAQDVQWAVLIGAHVRRPKSSRDPQGVFDLNTGVCHFPTRHLLEHLSVSLFMIDACNGNQMNLEGIDIPFVVCALDSVGYTGLVGKHFWNLFPDPFEIAKDAQESEKRRARWRVIIKP